MKIINVVGARPNFMKVAPLHRALLAHGGFESLIVHTGQHYDYEMNGVFFKEMAIPRPSINLNINACDHGEMTGRMLIALEEVFKRII